MVALIPKQAMNTDTPVSKRDLNASGRACSVELVGEVRVTFAVFRLSNALKSGSNGFLRFSDRL